MPNPIVHFEIPADDVARAKAFYENVFGWKIQQFPMPAGGPEYWGVTTRNEGAPGINGCLMKRNMPGQPFANYVDVKSIELMTNNPLKTNALSKLGIVVAKRIPLFIEANEFSARYLEVKREHGTFDKYIWQFVGGRPTQNAWRRHGECPAETDASRAMSRDLIKRGFRFVGPTICYAFMQATGMVNDHLRDCFRWREVRALNGDRRDG